MTTTTTACQARNPEFCRYHGSSRRGGFERSTLNHVTRLRTKYENATNFDAKFALEQELRDAEVDYAATVQGEEELRTRIENATSLEREQLESTLAEGLTLRARMEAEEEDGITSFPASKLDEAIKRVERANRKLERAGIDERFTYTVEDYMETDENGDRYSMVRFGISHPTISENGWSFVAAVDKVSDEGDVVTRVLPGQDLDGYRPEHFECEHCGSNRRRKATYLVRHENGEMKQVGSNCLEPFLGVKPKALWALSYDMEENGNLIDRGARERGGADSLTPTVEVVAAALAVSNEGENYISSSNAYNNGGVSTSGMVRQFFFGTRTNTETIDHTPYLARAQEIIQNTTFDGEGDYANNMRTLLHQEYVNPRHFGYVTSVVAAEGRARRQAEREAARASRIRSVGFIAPKGEKFVGTPVKIKKIVPFTSEYGYSSTSGRMIIMTTPEGHDIKWSTTGSDEAIWAVKEGQNVILDRATVKEHEHYNGDDQTVVKNAKISITE